MQFIDFVIDGGAIVYISKDSIAAIAEGKPDYNYTLIYLNGTDKFFKVRGNYKDVLNKLNIE